MADDIKNLKESIKLQEEYNDVLKISQSISTAISASFKNRIKNQVKQLSNISSSNDITKKILEKEKQIDEINKTYFGRNKKLGKDKTNAYKVQIDSLKLEKEKLANLEEFSDGISDQLNNIDGVNSATEILLSLEKQRSEIMSDAVMAEDDISKAKIQMINDTSKLLSLEIKRIKATEKVQESANDLATKLTLAVDGFIQSAENIPLVGGLIGGIISGPMKNLKDSFTESAKKFTTTFRDAIAQRGVTSFQALKIASGNAFAVIKAGLTTTTLGIFALVGVLIAVIKSFSDLSAAAEDFRVETGLTRSQTEGLEKSINNVVASTAKLGVNAEEVTKAASSFATQFQNTQVPSEEVLENIVVLNKNFGVSIDSLTEVNKLFTTLSGVSADTAQFMTSTVVEAANLAKVSPNQVIEDLSKNAKAAFTFFGGSVEALSAAAIEAAKLGTSIEQAAEVSKGLLNFESSITSELEASAILGRNINFNDARRLAASGEILEAQKAVLDEVSKLGDITKLNVFEQEALADAAGMPIQDLVFQQKIRNNLGELGKEELDLAMKQLKAGTDISDISKEQLQNQTDQLSKQQEIQSEVNQLKNAFMGVVAEVGSVLTPLLLDLIPVMKAILAPVKLMVDGFSMLTNFLRETTGLAKVLGTIVAGIAGYQTVIVGKQIASLAITKTKSILESGYLRILYLQDALQKKNLLKSIGQMASNAFISASKTPFIGPLLGAAAAASAFALGMSYFSKADDLMSMPSGYGNRVLSSPEGTFALNNNDTVVAGTNLGLGNNETPNNNLGFREEQPFQTTNILETNLSNENNMEVLSAPLNIMINEIKSLRQDIRNRKNEVYLDGKKVTAQISRQVDRSSKNSYAI